MLQSKDRWWLTRFKKKKKKKDPPICYVQEPHFRPKDTHRLKVRGWKRIFPVNGSYKKAEVAILRQNRL